MRLRPSNLAVALHCRGSLSLPSIEETTEGMGRGRDRHARLAAMPDVAVAAFALEGITVDVASIATEQMLTLDGISGTADVVGRTAEGETVVLDYKGENDFGDHSAQLDFYAIAAGARRYVVARVTDDLIITSTYRASFDDDYAEAFRKVLRALITSPTSDLSVGEWCRRCSSFRACPAQTTLVGGLVTLEPQGLTVSRAAEAWDIIKRHRDALDAVEATIRAMAASTPIPLSNGKTLGSVETSREYIDSARAIAAFPELAPLVKGSLTKEAVTKAMGKEGIVKLRQAGACKTELSFTVKEHA